MTIHWPAAAGVETMQTKTHERAGASCDLPTEAGAMPIPGEQLVSPRGSTTSLFTCWPARVLPEVHLPREQWP